MRRFVGNMTIVNKTVGLMMLGIGLSVVLWTSGAATPFIQRVAGMITTEISAGAAGNGYGGGGEF